MQSTDWVESRRAKVRNREAMHSDAGLEDEASVGTGATALGLPELLSALLTEVDKQHTEVTGEQEKITDLFDNVRAARRIDRWEARS